MYQRHVKATGAFMGALLFCTALSVGAQESDLQLIPGLKDTALILDIVARVVERDQEELWTSENSKVTIPGRPVTLKLVGQNVIVAVQFTPYHREDGKQMLVAQGQVWIDTPEEGIRYQTSMQTIPLDFGERIFFFPLGSTVDDGQASIEIQLELRPFVDAVEQENSEETENTDQETQDQ